METIPENHRPFTGYWRCRPGIQNFYGMLSFYTARRTFARSMLLTALLFSISIGWTCAQDGTLDTTFGDGGILHVDLGPQLTASSLLAQPDGKIIISAWFLNDPEDRDYIFLRYLPDGTPDNTFGENGQVIIDFFPSLALGSALLTDDGNIVCTGRVSSNAQYSDVALFSLQPDGSLDSSFGTRGYTILNSPATWESPINIIQRSNGKLLVVSTRSSTLSHHVILIQFSPDGLLDTTFGNHGILEFIPFSSRSNYADVEEMTNGNLLVVYETHYSSNTPDSVFVRRLNADGTPDMSFGQLGTIAFQGNLGNSRPQLKSMNDGRFLVSSSVDEEHYSLSCYRNNGNPDLTFGEGGIASIPTEHVITHAGRILQQPDGKIVLVNTSYAINSGTWADCVRFQNNGTIDQDFGESGISSAMVTTEFDISRSVYQFAATDSEGNIYHLRTSSLLGQDSHLMLIKWQGSAVATATSELVSANFELYPNPATRHVTIKSGEPLRDAQATLYGPSGQEVDIFHGLKGTQVRLELPHLAAGLYFVEISDRDGSSGIQPLVITRH